MNLILRTAFVLCTTLVFAAQVFAAEVQSYVVLPFTVHGGSNLTYLEKAVPSMLTSRLYWQGHVQPVSDAAAAKTTKAANAAAATKTLAATGADYVIWGDINVIGDDASLDIRIRNKAGKEWHKTAQSRTNDLIGTLQNVADGISADVFGRTLAASTGTSGSASVNQMNPGLVHNETTQSKVYLNPQFRYQGDDGTRYRSQSLPFAGVGMEVADVNGDGKAEIVVLGEHRLYVYRWGKQALEQLGEYKLPPNYETLIVRSIDLNRDGANEIIVSTYDADYTEPYSYVLSFKGNTFKEIATRVPYFMNVIKLAPEFMPTLVGQKGDSNRIFSRNGVVEMLPQGGTFVAGRKIDLPKDVNVFNFAWLPGKNGVEGDKLVMLTGDEHLRTFSNKGSQLSQSDEKFSGSAIGIAEQTNMPGLGKDTTLIPSKYFVPIRLLPTDLDSDGNWELLTNKPISVSAQYFENYRFFPEGEIHALIWDGVGLGLQWKTRRIKGSVLDLALADPNNDGVQDLVVAINTHPGALSLQNRKTVILAYPLDLSQTDPKTPPVLEN